MKWAMAVPSLALLVLSSQCLSQQAANTSSPPVASIVADAPPQQFSERPSRYKLRPGDVLNLTFTFQPEFNQLVTVQPDGYVSLRQVGDISVYGSTLAQAKGAILERYAKILRDPELDIDLKEFEKPYVIVTGQVQTPGRVELKGSTTALQAISLAGGFKDAAKHSQVLLFRRVNEGWVYVRLLNMKEMLVTADLREDPAVQAGDLLYVPKNTISKVKPFLPVPAFGMTMDLY